MQDAIQISVVDQVVESAPPEERPVSRFLRDLERLAASYLRGFFAGEFGSDGEPIPDKVLVNQRTVSLVLDMAIDSELCLGVERFYEILAEKTDLQPGMMVRYLVGLLHECHRMGIPKCMISGLACVHADLVGHWGAPPPRLVGGV